MSRILGIDYGEKNIGLAVSDPTNHFSFPIETIHNDDKLIEKLKEIITTKNIKTAVVGWPLNLKGEMTQKTKEVEIFIEMLKNNISINIEKIDERLSSKEAYNFLMESKEMNHSRKKKNTDKIAASIILQKYLDTENNRRKT